MLRKTHFQAPRHHVRAGCALALTVIGVTLAASSQATTVTYTTPNVYDFTVPLGVTSVLIQIAGAGGGGENGEQFITGGSGALVSGDLSVVPGEGLTIYVGGGGQSSYPGAGYGGFPGGGGDATSGSGGGGYTEIVVNDNTHDFAIAGAGGGAAGANGGNGGIDGQEGGTYTYQGQNYQGGGGGTQFAGGVGYGGVNGDHDGSQFQGGQSYQGGGGGGGYYGGGGGFISGGGGGGSSYIAALTNAVVTTGAGGAGGAGQAYGYNGLALLTYNAALIPSSTPITANFSGTNGTITSLTSGPYTTRFSSTGAVTNDLSGLLFSRDDLTLNYTPLALGGTFTGVDLLTTLTGQTLDLNVGGTFTEPDGGALDFAGTATVTGGSLDLSGTCPFSVTVTPNEKPSAISAGLAAPLAGSAAGFSASYGTLPAAGTAAVPEPCPLALLTLGLLPAGLAVRLRRGCRD